MSPKTMAPRRARLLAGGLDVAVAHRRPFWRFASMLGLLDALHAQKLHFSITPARAHRHVGVEHQVLQAVLAWSSRTS